MIHKYIFSVFILIVSGFLFQIRSGGGGDFNPETRVDFSSNMKGVCWVAGDSIESRNLDNVVKIGANWISQTPFAWQGRYNEPEIRMSTDRVLWGERDSGLKHTTSLARKRNLKTILKPHIWVRRSDGKWRADIEMKNAEDWDRWFADYEKMIMHYAKLAEKNDIEALCIGTELYITTNRYPERWRKIIRNIRSVYSGQLTYAANFHKEFESIVFWDELDFIGVQGYFPLTSKEHPSVDALVKSWKRPKQKLKRIANKYHKPVVFTEVGYTNISTAGDKPWIWPQQLEADLIELSNETQANCYEAMFRTFWNEPWFGGVFIWKWFHGGYKSTLEERNRLRAERMDSLRRSGSNRFRNHSGATFSPQNKPAEVVLMKWYAGS